MNILYWKLATFLRAYKIKVKEGLISTIYLLSNIKINKITSHITINHRI